jgi:hypothetical protein
MGFKRKVSAKLVEALNYNTFLPDKYVINESQSFHSVTMFAETSSIHYTLSMV